MTTVTVGFCKYRYLVAVIQGPISQVFWQFQSWKWSKLVPPLYFSKFEVENVSSFAIKTKKWKWKWNYSRNVITRVATLKKFEALCYWPRWPVLLLGKLQAVSLCICRYYVKLYSGRSGFWDQRHQHQHYCCGGRAARRRWGFHVRK